MTRAGRLRMLFLLLPAIAILLVWTAVYRTVAIDVPSAFSRRYRGRFQRPLWNKLIAWWGRSLLLLTRRLVGLRVLLEGGPPRGRCIVVANHQSAAEIAVLLSIFRDQNLKFVVTHQLARWKPNVSPAVRRGGFAAVDPRELRRNFRVLRSFARSLPDWDGSPVIYPEGKRTEDGSVGTFHGAGLKVLVRETGLPVQPVVIDGLWRARTVNDFLDHLPGAVCRLRFLPLIPAEQARGQVDVLAERLESEIREGLRSMRAEHASAA